MKVLFLLTLLSIAGNAFAKRHVLLTAFEPFGGRSTNGSKEVASLLPAMSDPSVEYTVCILPVEYDRASAKAEECYQAMDPKPDMVISTGEGACNIQVETRAMNYDDTPSLADNAGQVRIQTPIDQNGTPYTFLSLPAADMICAIESPDQWQRPNASTWAGYFVCNNTAFHLARFMRTRQTPYGFIHVPRMDCGRPPSVSADTLNTMIRAGINSLESRATAEGRFVCEAPLPNLNEQISPLLSVARQACEKSYREVAADLLIPPPARLSGDVKQ